MALFSNKTICVTGGSRGIGAACIQYFLEHGAQQIISLSRSGQLAPNIDPQKVLSFSVDVSSQESINDLSKTLNDKNISIDILVNNAGITKDNLLIRMKPEEWNQVIQTNLTSVFLLTKALIRNMIKKKWGRIINISSISGIIGTPGQANYAAAKAGIIGLSKSIAKEYAQKGITVNVVAPGWTDTDMTKSLNQDYLTQVTEMIPMKSIGQPEDIAYCVGFLAQEEAHYITGQTISVDGGLNM